MQFAVSYENKETCSFCRLDTTKCENEPDWVKYQLGSLDCDYCKKNFHKFDKCWIEDKVPCGPVTKLLRETVQDEYAPISFLQIDIEGYEHVLIPGLLQELSFLPPVIHYEEKVMAASDEKYNSTRVQTVQSVLREYGYILFPQGEDVLALRVSDNSAGLDTSSYVRSRT